MINLLQTTYVNPGIVSAESSLCATIHWGSACVFLICSHTFKQCLLKNTGVFCHQDFVIWSTFADDFRESRHCKCWENPLCYDPLRFSVCFSDLFTHILNNVYYKTLEIYDGLLCHLKLDGTFAPTSRAVCYDPLRFSLCFSDLFTHI